MNDDETPASLFAEVVALFHRLKVVADQLHGQGEQTAGRRGILRGLASGGPQTVPQMARARPVSRQHVQTLVNTLLADGLVELAPNPAHRRSPLVRLTSRGLELVAEMDRREGQALRGFDLGVSARELQAAVRSLRTIRQALGGSAWQARVRAAASPRRNRRSR